MWFKDNFCLQGYAGSIVTLYQVLVYKFATDVFSSLEVPFFAPNWQLQVMLEKPKKGVPPSRRAINIGLVSQNQAAHCPQVEVCASTYN